MLDRVHRIIQRLSVTINKKPRYYLTMKGKNSSTTSNEYDSSLLMLCIPEDQWQIILSFLPCPDLLKLSLVSTHLRSITTRTYTLITEPKSQSRTNHHSKKAIRYPCSNTANDPISRFVSNPKSCYTNAATASVAPSNANNANIPFLSQMLNKHDAKTEQFTSLLERFQNLRTIILHDLAIMEDFILPIINACPAARSLKRLELHSVRILHDRHALALSPPPANDDGYNCDRVGNNGSNETLRHVVLSGTMFCSYQNVLKSFTTSPRLQYLELSGCRLLTDSDVHHFITTRTTRLKNLHQDTTTTSTNINHHHHRIYDQIHTLSLSNSSQLTKPKIKSPLLHTLNLSNCPLLKTLPQFCCPNLTDLDLSYCTSLRDPTVVDILNACPVLSRLCLLGCRELVEVRLESGSLRSVDLDMCVGLRSVRFECDSLTNLQISMCAKLSKFTFTGSSLTELNLSMLPMNELKLTAPSLEALNLSGCFRLNDSGVEYNCPALYCLDICGTEINRKHFRRSKNDGGRKIDILTGGSSLDWVNNSF